MRRRIDLATFLNTGSFGGVRVGDRMSEVRRRLGPPQWQWRTSEGGIYWYYGASIEIGFYERGANRRCGKIEIDLPCGPAHRFQVHPPKLFYGWRPRLPPRRLLHRMGVRPLDYEAFRSDPWVRNWYTVHQSTIVTPGGALGFLDDNGEGGCLRAVCAIEGAFFATRWPWRRAKLPIHLRTARPPKPSSQ